jgi:hypothetical protein
MEADRNSSSVNNQIITAINAQHTIMFWVLMSLALVVFAPAVLLPAWQEYEKVCWCEEVLADRVADLQARIDRNEVCIEGLLADPLVNQRLLRRELNYRSDGEKVFRHYSASLASVEPDGADLGTGPMPTDFTVDPATVLPSPIAQIIRWLPNWPWRALFVEMPNRAVMLCAAGCLLITAFVLYGPRGRTPSP